MAIVAPVRGDDLSPRTRLFLTMSTRAGTTPKLSPDPVVGTCEVIICTRTVTGKASGT